MLTVKGISFVKTDNVNGFLLLIVNEEGVEDLRFSQQIQIRNGIATTTLGDPMNLNLPLEIVSWDNTNIPPIPFKKIMAYKSE